MTHNNPQVSDDELPPPEPVNPGKVTTTCHCGRVSVEMPSRPSEVNECRCSICYRYGALWAYFPRDEVNVLVNVPGPPHGGSTGPGQEEETRGLKSYLRSDGTGHIKFYLCDHCGCLIHWGMTEKGLAYEREVAEKEGQETPEPTVGVNCRMLPPKRLEGVKRRRSMDGDF